MLVLKIDEKNSPRDALKFWRCRGCKETTFVYLDGLQEQHVTSRRRQIGGGRLKAILYTAVFVMAIYSAVKFVPAYVAEYQLADKMQEQARFAVVNRYTEEQIRDNLFRVIQDLEIPAKREDIKISANSSIVKISMEYTVPVDLLFYHLDLHFSPASENKSLI
jgi:hypothetical protein